MSKRTKGASVTGIIVVVVIAIIIIIALIAVAKPTSQSVNGGAAYLSLLSPSNGLIEVGQVQNVKWSSTNYGAPTVALNVIRKVSNDPAEYELVRTVSSATKNDGSAVWVPAKSDVGNDILVEVGCTPSSQECHASESESPLAVIDSGLYSNTAASYAAIEQAQNQ